MSDAIAIQADRLSKRFVLRHNRAGSIKERVLALAHPGRRERLEEFWALRDVSVTIRRGEAVGLVGRNGSGKSTLLKLVAGIHTPTSGRLLAMRGARIGTMIELGVGFHHELTAVENVYLNAAIHGLSRRQVDALLPSIIEYSGLASFMDVPLKNFSSGMHTRLGFAVAAHLQPDILLIDEVFAVGDADFQRQCVATMADFRRRGCTIVFVSHAAGAVSEVCERVCVLDAGRLVYDGGTADGLAFYQALREADGTSVLPGAEARVAPEEEDEPDKRAHRLAMGGAWAELGPWAARFLRERGLAAHHYLLDLGCGSLPVAIELLPSMEQSHYWGFDVDHELYDAGVRVELPNMGVRVERGHFVVNAHFDLSRSPHLFDFVIGHSLAHRLTPDQLARAVAAAIGHLSAEGSLFLAIPLDLEAHRAAVAEVCQRLGASMTLIDNAGHPRGEPVYEIRMAV